MTRYLHTMYRITDPEKSRRFYEALGFTFAGDFDIVRNGELEATNYFFSIGEHESVLELTYNHDRLDLHELLRIAEQRDAEERARRAGRTEAVGDDVPRPDELRAVARDHVDG